MSHLVCAKKRSLWPGAVALLALVWLMAVWAGSAAAQTTADLTITKETNLPGGTDFSFWKVEYLTKWGSFGTGNGQFSAIVDVAVDGSGNVYVLESAINQGIYRVQKFSSTGTYITKWGTQGSGPGQFNSANGIAVDAAGNVYVADTWNHRIQKFDGAGTFLAQWGTQGSGDGQFQYPMDVALDGTGNIYVADANNYRIQKFDSAGTFITQWGGTQGTGNGQFDGLASIAVDGTGNVYVSETWNNHRIQKFDSAGAFLGIVGGPGGADGQFDYPNEVAVDGAGNVYVADSQHNRIQMFDSAGEFVAKWGSAGTGDGQLSGPIGVAVDASGNVFVAEWNNSRVQKFSAPAGVSLDDGQSHTWADLSPGTVLIGERLPAGWSLSDLVCDGGSPDESQNTAALTLAAGDDVTCVFSNMGTARVTITKETNPPGAQDFSFTLSPGPVASAAKWGSQGSGSGRFNFPTDLSIDGTGNIYVADQSNHRIQKFDNSGTIITQWGIQGVSAGRFNYPQDVAVDGAGNVYVADTINHRVQKFDSSGAFLMAWGWDVVVGGGTGFEVCTPTDTCKAAANGSGDGQFIFPNRLAVDGAGHVYVVDATRRVQKFDAATGAFILKWGSNGNGDNQFGQAAGIAVDAAGNVYVADQTNARIQKFDSNGTFLVKWGKNGSADGQFNFPSDVSIDAAGNVYVADNGNNRIQMLDSNGIFLDKWGSYGSGDGQFQNPNGVAVDASGNVFVVEQNNHRVQKFSPATIVLDDGQSHTYEGLRPGTYNALELLPNGWELNDITCDGGSPAESGDGVTLTLAPGDDVACTFLNDGPEASLFITKVVAGNGAPADWSYAFTGDLGSFTLTDDSPITTNGSVTPGAVAVSETNPAGYATSFACDSGDTGSSGNLSLTLADNEVVNCTVTNAICQPGSYDTAAGWSCAPAGPGYYVDTIGASAQIACPSGMTSPAGSDSVDDCVTIPTASLTLTKETNPDGGTNFPFTLLGLDKWGTYGTTGGRFNDPRGVATTGPVVYVADYSNNRIQKFDSDGAFLLAWGRDVVAGGGTGFEICTPTDTCQAGTTGGGKGQFNGPYGVAVDASGNVYVADSNNFRVQKFDPGGNFLLAWGWDVVVGGGTGFEICTPADTCKAGAHGSGDGQLSSVLGVEVDGTSVYVADTFNQRVQKFDTGGNYVTQWGGSGNGNGQFYYPIDLATNGMGHVYVLDLDLERVQKFTTGGAYLAQWGSYGSGNGQFDIPSAIAADGAGNVYVIEGSNHRVQKFDGDGAYLTQWGGLGSGDGQFNTPFGLAADAAGNLYVSEAMNYRVQKLVAGGSVALDDDESHTFSGLIPGTYQINEQNPPGWVLDDVDCGPAQVSRNGHTVSLALAADDDITCTFTNSPPATVTINQTGGQADPTGSSPILFRVVFSKPVSGFETGDVTLSGAAGATTAAVTEIAPNDGTTYRVAVSGMSAGGLVIATVEAGVAQDNSGFGNEASTSTDNEVTFTFTAPQLTIAKETNPDGATGFPFTLLGVKTWGSSGSGNGQFATPYGMAVDGAGNVYVADLYNHRIQKFNAGGGYLAQWGSPGSGDGQFQYPAGVAADGAGNVYVTDLYNNRIQKFDADGNYLGQWGSIGSGDGQFQYPYGVAADGAGNVYVADTYNNRIQRFDADGNYLGQWGSTGSGDGQFNTPFGVVADSSGNVYVADTYNHRIQKFDSDGNYLAQWGGFGSGNSQFSYPNGVGVDGTGNVTVADTSNNRIQNFDSNGNYLNQWGASGSGDGQFNSPIGVAVDGASNVYVADSNNNRIQKFNQTGVVLDDDESHNFEDLASGTYFITEQVPAGWWLDGIDCDGGSPVVDGSMVRLALAGGDDVTCTFTNNQPATLTITKATNPTGGTGFPFTIEPGTNRYVTQWGGFGSGNGLFISPTGVAADGAGNVYVADTYNDLIQKFDSDGNYLDQWGGTGSGDGQFQYPQGVAADGAGNVYVADQSNHRIQKFDSGGNYLDQWGSYGSGDGQFYYPLAVVVDGAGNVYVADTYNNRIQKFDGDGNYLDQWGGYGSGDGQFSNPTGVAADGAGNVYVVDQSNGRIQKFDGDGNYLGQWGSYGSADGQFQYPFGVAADGAGNVYVADQSNHRIQKFDDDGNFLGQWGGYGSGDGQLNSPTGVAADGAGNIYVADYGNSRIQKFGPAGATLDDGQSHTFSDLTAGVYVITEAVPGGWYLTDIDCGGATATRDGDSVSVTVEGGDDVECVFTNSDTPPPTTGSIRVTKEIIGSGTGTFTICVETDCKAFSGGDGEQQTWADLAPGDYTVSEQDAGPDWDEPAAQEVTVVAGQTADATVTNTYDPPPTTGSIRVTKEIIGSGTGTFTICVESDCKSFSAGDGEQQTWADLTPGDYTVSEQDAGPDWDEPAAQEVTVVAGQTADATVTNTYDSPAGVFMSAIAAGTTSDGLAYGSEDILLWDGTAWSTWFDGSAAGLEPKKAKHDIDAIWIPDPDGEEFIFSFTQNRRTIPGVGPNVDGMDLVRWDGSAFSFWFDGSDVFLTNKTQEKIDALHILPGGESPIGSGCLAYLLVSTQGPGKVPNFNGGQLKFQGEDVLGFCATSLGQTTAGLWHMVLDGSAAGMPRNSTDSISVSDDGQTMYLTTQGAFNVDAAAGGHSMVYAYDFATGTFSGPVFSAPAAGLPEKVDGLQMN